MVTSGGARMGDDFFDFHDPTNVWLMLVLLFLIYLMFTK